MMAQHVDDYNLLPQETLDQMFEQALHFMPPSSKAYPLPKATSPPSTAWSLVGSTEPDPDDPGSPPEGLGNAGCEHARLTRKGSNGYVNMLSCVDCGKVILKEYKQRDERMKTNDPLTCRHAEVHWKGTNGNVWRWTCKDCGHYEVTPKTEGNVKPIPMRPPDTLQPPPPKASASSTTARPTIQQSMAMSYSKTSTPGRYL